MATPKFFNIRELFLFKDKDGNINQEILAKILICLNDERYYEKAQVECISIFKKIPDCHKTENMYRLYVKYGGLLKDVPQEFQNEEIFEDALCNSENFELIPTMFTKEKCIQFIEKKRSKYALLQKYLQKLENTTNPSQLVFTVIEIEKHPHLFKWLDEDLKTKELCMAMVNAYNDNSNYIPEKIYDQELCDFLFEKDAYLYGKFPIKFRNQWMSDRIYELCKKENKLIATIPAEHLDIDKWIEISCSRTLCLLCANLPESLKSKEFYEKAFANNVHIIIFMDKKYQTEEMWLKAIETRDTLLNYLPDKFLTEDFKLKISNIFNSRTS